MPWKFYVYTDVSHTHPAAAGSFFVRGTAQQRRAVQAGGVVSDVSKRLDASA